VRHRISEGFPRVSLGSETRGSSVETKAPLCRHINGGPSAIRWLFAVCLSCALSPPVKYDETGRRHSSDCLLDQADWSLEVQRAPRGPPGGARARTQVWMVYTTTTTTFTWDNTTMTAAAPTTVRPLPPPTQFFVCCGRERGGGGEGTWILGRRLPRGGGTVGTRGGRKAPSTPGAVPRPRPARHNIHTSRA